VVKNNILWTADFEYTLPRELIAQSPIEPRDSSRLLVLNRDTGQLFHQRFNQITSHLEAGDLLVFNDSRVIPARLRGHRIDTGSSVELLLIRRHASCQWWCLAKPARRLHHNVKIQFPLGVTGSVVDSGNRGLRLIEFSDENMFESIGEVALPPYIHEPLIDPERYQTVYSKIQGSVAAPTAGLHFTPLLLDRLQRKGIEVSFVTLHVGMDTFMPVDVADPTQHHLHTEYFELSRHTSDSINQARSNGRRVIAIGTTTVRVLEQAAKLDKIAGTPFISPVAGWADLFILPGYEFSVVDGIITNFHLPRSTLLMMISAFTGYERMLKAYYEAIEKRYRFYSFGDCMLIL